MSLRQQYAYVTARFSGNTAPVVNTLEYVKGLWTKVYGNPIKWNTDF